jgi:hypothetical protein
MPSARTVVLPSPRREANPFRVDGNIEMNEKRVSAPRDPVPACGVPCRVASF